MIKSLSVLNPFFSFDFSLNLKIKPKLSLFLSLVLIIFLLALCVFQFNKEASERYLIKEYKAKAASIELENKMLEIKFEELSSLDNILASVEKMNFEKTNKVNYIKIINNQIVSR